VLGDLELQAPDQIVEIVVREDGEAQLHVLSIPGVCHIVA